MNKTEKPTEAQAEALEIVNQWADWIIDVSSDMDSELGGRNQFQLEHEKLRRHIEQAGAVPEGYALVPVEPTEEMKNACDKTPGPITAWKAWQVMLAAAPKQEATDD